MNLLAVELSTEKIGCVGVLVDAKSDARDFYARYGFIELEPEAGELAAHFQATPLFLGVQRIRAALTSH